MEQPPGSIAESFLGKINEAAKAAEEAIMPAAKPVVRSIIATTTPDGIILSLTKNQFEFLYPASFISSLVDAQASFIKVYDSAYQPITKIETDKQVRLIEEKIVSTLLASGDITKEQAERFITTIRFTLPQLQVTDIQKYGPLNYYDESSPFLNFLSNLTGNQALTRVAPKGLFLAGLLEKLSGGLANNAQAATCGTCSASPECFQEGASIPAKAGTEQIKFACTCTGCLTALGCLSSCQGQAAIFDQLTGICGCGL
jgi:hypothetical protein